MTSCTSIVDTEHASFTIPSGFDQYETNDTTAVILKVMYKNEMYIIVQDDLGDLIKKSKINNYTTMKMAHSIKFMMIKTKYEGYNETEQKSYLVDGRNVIEQEFAANEIVGNVYYKYYIVEVNNHFLEVTISGKSNLKTKQIKICEEFIRNIKPTKK